MRRLVFTLAAILIAAALYYRPDAGPGPAPTPATTSAPAARPAPSPTAGQQRLPPGVAEVVGLIQRGGPFPHRQDGTVFGNREGRLPPAARGYYHEYTVPTPGAPDRGARRLVTGGDPPVDWYYTDDHYRSFRQLDPEAVEREATR